MAGAAPPKEAVISLHKDDVQVSLVSDFLSVLSSFIKLVTCFYWACLSREIILCASESALGKFSCSRMLDRGPAVYHVNTFGQPHARIVCTELCFEPASSAEASYA